MTATGDEGDEAVDSRKWQPVAGSMFGSGGSQSVLRSDHGQSTSLVRTAEARRLSINEDLGIFVVLGAGVINDQSFSTGCYMRVRPGTVDFRPDGELHALVFLSPSTSGETRHDTMSAVKIFDTHAMDWQPSASSSLAYLKPIISDQMGQVFMSAFLPGHSTSLEESHPISEEVYRLAGSLYDHSSGWSHPGDYSYRQPNLFHGPLASIDGTMSIVRSSGPITTRHRSPGSYWSGLSTASLVATYRPPSLANLGGGQ